MTTASAGGCTVIADGRRVLSCLTLAASCEGRAVTTIEGLAKGDDLHPMQAAFVKHDGFQCGYCTPGQSALPSPCCRRRRMARQAMSLQPDRIAPDMQLSDEEIRERMSGNICRCGADPILLTQFARSTADATSRELASPGGRRGRTYF